MKYEAEMIWDKGEQKWKRPPEDPVERIREGKLIVDRDKVNWNAVEIACYGTDVLLDDEPGSEAYEAVKKDLIDEVVQAMIQDGVLEIMTGSLQELPPGTHSIFVRINALRYKGNEENGHER